MNIEIGKNIRQANGFSAFIPSSFPPKELFRLPTELILKTVETDRLVGKLDGVIHTLPDVDCFLKMFVQKDAVASSQIEGTKATIIDALEREHNIMPQKADDADDILFYVKALNHGLKRIREDNFPLSLRLLREIHKELMMGARSTHFSDPGEFRVSQNYIGGSRPGNAVFVPPPVTDMKRALSDFEKFLHEKNMLPLIHIGLAHAQFETIHPFLDGNGRSGRLLITLLFYHKKLLEQPVLFLSSYFKKHQQMYYQSLNNYHEGKVETWISFFLSAVMDTAKDSINIAKQIRKLQDSDTTKIQSLGKRESVSSFRVLSYLFSHPLVTVAQIMNCTGFTRAGAQKVINRFISLGILEPRPGESNYGKTYIYKKYLSAFQKD